MFEHWIPQNPTGIYSYWHWCTKYYKYWSIISWNYNRNCRFDPFRSIPPILLELTGHQLLHISRTRAAAFFSFWISSNGISGSSLTAWSTWRLAAGRSGWIANIATSVSLGFTENIFGGVPIGVPQSIQNLIIYIVLKPVVLGYAHSRKPDIAFFFWSTKHVTKHYKMDQNGG